MNYSVRNIVIAVSLAACAVVAVLIYTSNVESQSKSGVVLTKVQEAVRDIPAGTPWSQVVKGGMLKEVEIVKSDQLPGVLVADDVKANRFAGMVVGQPLYQGEQVPDAVFTESTTAAPAIQVQGDMRAIQLPFDADSGLIGTVKTGDHVDVLEAITVTKPDGTEAHIARRLLTDVEVLKAPDPSAGSGSQGHILLKVADTDAVKLLWAFKYANLYMVVRPQSAAKDSLTTVPTLESMVLDGLNHQQIHDILSTGLLKAR